MYEYVCEFVGMKFGFIQALPLLEEKSYSNHMWMEFTIWTKFFSFFYFMSFILTTVHFGYAMQDTMSTILPKILQISDRKYIRKIDTNCLVHKAMRELEIWHSWVLNMRYSNCLSHLRKSSKVIQKLTIFVLSLADHHFKCIFIYEFKYGQNTWYKSQCM